MNLDALFPAMPILHKYNFSKLLQQTELLVPSEEAWATGTKKAKHSLGEWLWLAEELQLVGLLDALSKLLQGFSMDRDDAAHRLLQILQEVKNAAQAKNQATAAGAVLAQFDRLGIWRD
eukprot:gene7104-208_t